MTQYQNKSFSVMAPGTQQYRDNWDAIFGKTDLETFSVRQSNGDVFEYEVGSLTQEQAMELARNSTELRKQVAEFKHASEQPVLYVPQTPPKERLQFSLRLIAEEFFELLYGAGCNADDVMEAEDWVKSAIDYIDIENCDLSAVVDASGDIDYCVEGLRLECGVNSKPVADEIHRANLSKFVDGKPVKHPETGKTMKGPNYTPPDVAGELRKQGW